MIQRVCHFGYKACLDRYEFILIAHVYPHHFHVPMGIVLQLCLINLILVWVGYLSGRKLLAISMSLRWFQLRFLIRPLEKAWVPIPVILFFSGFDLRKPSLKLPSRNNHCGWVYWWPFLKPSCSLVSLSQSRISVIINCFIYYQSQIFMREDEIIA